jgi:hypothetical protein
MKDTIGTFAKPEAAPAITATDVRTAVVGALTEHFSDWRKFEITIAEAEVISELVISRLPSLEGDDWKPRK